MTLALTAISVVWLSALGVAQDAAPKMAPSLELGPPPVVNAATMDSWRKQIIPDQDDLRWRDIPWRSELGAAAREAGELSKPILLWAMNGHPLGCT